MKKREAVKLVIFSKLSILLVVSLISAVIFVVSMRSNYSEMVELREAVKVADENNKDVEKALQNLREHVHSHMNTDLTSGANAIRPPIQLKGEYERLLKKEQSKVKQANENVAEKAKSICASRYPAGGLNPPRVACIQDYIQENSVEVGGVQDDLYKFDFVSPKWSPDLAGFSLVVLIASLSAFMIGAIYKIIKQYHL